MGYIRIPPYVMYEMISAFSIHISVATFCNYRELRIYTLDGYSQGKSSSVETIEEVGIHILRHLCSLSYSGSKYSHCRFNSKFLKGFLQSFSDTEVSASRAPGYINFMTEFKIIHDRPPILSSISSMENGSPLYFRIL